MCNTELHQSLGLYFLLDDFKVNCADSNVGDAKVRGISGGEKKRLSVACELIASPSVIFADEPTTGTHFSIRLLQFVIICYFYKISRGHLDDNNSLVVA